MVLPLVAVLVALAVLVVAAWQTQAAARRLRAQRVALETRRGAIRRSRD
ncbi:MAG: hypothetical protein U5R31_04520 [Acidimicrobiia bacterium]|nr:hypothetical protein [Acidimicrobiia bacterium]